MRVKVFMGDLIFNHLPIPQLVETDHVKHAYLRQGMGLSPSVVPNLEHFAMNISKCAVIIRVYGVNIMLIYMYDTLLNTMTGCTCLYN